MDILSSLSRQSNVGEQLINIKDNLEKSLKSWEPFLNLIEVAILDEDWKFIRDIQIPIEKSLGHIKRALQDNDPVKKSVSPGDTSTILEVCSVCRSLVNSKDVDWKFMKETNTWQVVCKDCAKIFDNYKGDK